MAKSRPQELRNPWLRGLMEHHRRSLQPGIQGEGRKVTFDKPEGGVAQQPGEITALLSRRVRRGEAVDADHLVAALDKGLGELGAD